VSAARNRGVELSTGSLIAFLDSDDEWVPDKLEVQLRRFEDDDAPIAVYSGLYIDDGKSRHATAASVEGRAFERFLALPGPITTTGLIVDRARAGDELHFDETLGCAVEGDLLIRLSRDHVIGRVQRPLYVWYHHDGPHVAQDRCYAVARLKIIQKYWADLESRPQLAAYCYFRLALTQRKVGNYAGARRSVWKAARLNPGDTRLRVLDAIGGLGQTPLRLALGAYAGAGRIRRARELRRGRANPALGTA
jgi:glycosyltransferase involved in cell wall biosynthesis